MLTLEKNHFHPFEPVSGAVNWRENSKIDLFSISESVAGNLDENDT
jgi:hypothetical protein